MAQTRRKRRTKHRGTAAGSIQARGRTSRPASPQERKKLAREEAREKRMNTPPTWKSAVLRAASISVILFLFVALTAKKDGPGTGAAIALLAFLLYVPSGYYLELYLYRRRQRRKQAGK